MLIFTSYGFKTITASVVVAAICDQCQSDDVTSNKSNNQIRTQHTINLVALLKSFAFSRILLVLVEREPQEAMWLGVKLTTKPGSRTEPEWPQMEASLKDHRKYILATKYISALDKPFLKTEFTILLHSVV